LPKWQVTRPVSRRIITFAALLAPIFTGIALVQMMVVRHQSWAALRREQEAWVKDIAAEVAYTDKWNLNGYRNASIVVPAWYVVTSSGLVVDIEGYMPGIFRTASLPPSAPFESPKTIISELGEAWRILARKLDGGVVVVGMPASGSLPSADQKLRQNVAAFPSNVEHAISTRSRSIDAEVDYAILRDTGELAGAWGGIPLLLDQAFLRRFSGGETRIKVGDKSYAVFSTPIIDVRGKPVASIIMPRDVTPLEAALHSEAVFNIVAISGLWLLVVLSSAPFVHMLLSRQQRLASLRQLLCNQQLVESGTIEFKPAFQWDSRVGQQRDELRLEFLLKPVAAFLNADGGTLFIGVSDDGRICGIEPDLALFNHSTNRLELEMMQLIGAKISPTHTRFVRIRVDHVSTEPSNGAQPKPVCIVDVDPAPRPAFLRWDRGVHFYKRAGNKSEPLRPIEQHDYIQTRWG
jgi:hypothetical protein